MSTPAPGTRHVAITLSAYRLAEYREVIEVPDDITDDELDDLIEARYDAVDAVEYTIESNYWERRDNDLAEAGPDEAPSFALHDRTRMTVIPHPGPSLVDQVRELCRHVGIRCVQADEPEILGRWDWLGESGDASDQSYATELDAGVDALRKRYAMDMAEASLQLVRSDDQFIAYVKAHLDPAIRGRYIKQAWDSSNNSVNLGEESFVATEHVLAMRLEDIHELEDMRWSTDNIGEAHVNHDGPHEVVITESIRQFFDVEELSEITQDQLEQACDRYGVQPCVPSCKP